MTLRIWLTPLIKSLSLLRFAVSISCRSGCRSTGPPVAAHRRRVSASHGCRVISPATEWRRSSQPPPATGADDSLPRYRHQLNRGSTRGGCDGVGDVFRAVHIYACNVGTLCAPQRHGIRSVPPIKPPEAACGRLESEWARTCRFAPIAAIIQRYRCRKSPNRFSAAAPISAMCKDPTTWITLTQTAFGDAQCDILLLIQYILT